MQFDDCEGSLRLTRRGFLQAAAVLSFSALPDLSFADTPGDTRLMVILLRGGMDGLHVVPPIGDKHFQSVRRHIDPDKLAKLDGHFGLHPALQAVKRFYDSGQALIAHATSVPYTGRSHFAGQNVMESGVLKPYSSPTGWLGRALDASGYQAALSMSLPVPLILRGRTLADNSYPTYLPDVPPDFYKALRPLWGGDAALQPIAERMIEDAGRPPGQFSSGGGDDVNLADLARDAGNRLKAVSGPRVAVLDYIGFDSHADEPSSYNQRLQNVDNAIQTFAETLGDVWKDTLVVTLTEFGRTVAANGSNGTDHGYASAVFVVGGKLKKSGIVSDWPGLDKKNLYQERDLMATLDSRSLYGKIVSSAFQLPPDLVNSQVLEHTPTNVFDAYL